MKKLLLLLAITGTLFACSKDDDNEELTSLEVLQQAIAATDQEAVTNQIGGVWMRINQYGIEESRMTITKDRYITEINIDRLYPDTLTNIKPNWAKINDTYQLIQVKDSVFQPIGFYLEKDDNNQLYSEAGPVCEGLSKMPGSEVIRVLQELSTYRPYHTKYTKVK